MFNVYDKYIIRQLLLSTLVIAGSLSMIILLTQSLRLIELVLESNASGASFFTMMALSLPRFVEAVLPASVLIATLFVLHRLTMDSEMIVMRASGASPLRMAKPVIKMGLILMGALLILSLWVSPTSIAHMHTLRQEIRAQYGHLLFREGIFNSVGRNLTAYVQARAPDGQLTGLMLHDTRGENPVTIVARSGQLISEPEGQKILVFDGSRQEIDKHTGKFSRLDFKQYTLDMPTSAEDTSERWREPDERTIGELTDEAQLATETEVDRLQFRAEVHRRLTTPLLMMAFALLAAVFLLQGSFSRGGQMHLIVLASITALTLQGLYLFAYNLAKKTLIGCILLYGISAVPVCMAMFFLLPSGERLLLRISESLRRMRRKA
ncbi:MAG: LPS export ABC transporter permease LptF [Alphaproteobacteria bacterium]|nr:LPS export ABC transporter permease LptF [Alphaproteobacteria bacterium]